MDKSSFSPDNIKGDIPNKDSFVRGDTNEEAKRKHFHYTIGMYSLPSELKLFGSDYFLNYQLSWLKFNWRVLFEAQNEHNPLLERLKFIGIVAGNLDEFFQKRVGGLKRQLEAGIETPPVDGMSPEDQLKAIRLDVTRMVEAYRDCFLNSIIPSLSKEGVHFKRYFELSLNQRKIIEEYFNRQLYPILTPLAVDKSHPFPLISNKSRSFAVELRQPQTGDILFARVKVPSNRQRWLIVEKEDHEITYVSIDDVIKAHIHQLFPGMEVLSANVFRVTRNADVERNEEEADDLLELITEELRERRFAEIVRLEIDQSMPGHIKEFLIEKMEISWGDVYEMEGPIGLADCIKMSDLTGFEQLKYDKWVPTLHPVFHHELDEETPDIFSIIRNGDFIVHHPYHSFATSVQRFVEEAADDPKVLAIKQTLYRTSSDSPLMHALMKAAQQGKQVAMLVELKARFDEERNIEWGQKLEKAGVHVAYGLPGLKIHSKLTIVVREEEDGNIKSYVHLSTGNYHPKTAQLYEDLGLFTCDPEIASDVTDLFNFLTGYAPEQNYKKLIVAPNYMREKMTKLIEYEINECNNDRTGRIIAKMNSLEDPLIIQKLYEASKAGVQIDIIVRGVCRLIPQKKGLSENIRIHSIIGRFLEHSRIYYFQHGDKDLHFIGSADWMHRNLDARVESLVPIEENQLKKYLQFILNIYLNDNGQRWVLESDGSYTKVERKGDEPFIQAHDVLMKHTSKTLEPVPKTT
jgi:polyphosphate kinase